MLTALPSEGCLLEPPEFPMPAATGRELELWVQVWGTPQACAWHLEPWRWYVVAQYVRWSVKAEAEDASAAVVAACIRFADQIGLTPAGLKDNGWAVASDELGARRDVPVVAKPKARDRMKVVSGGEGA